MTSLESKYACDILLVSPSLDWESEKQRKENLRIEPGIPNQESPNIGIAYLLAVLAKKGIIARFIDMPAHEISLEDVLAQVEAANPLVVGFNAFTHQIKTAAKIAEMIKAKRKEITIVVGGAHATALPERTLAEMPAFDYVVSGEGELALPLLYSCLKDGKDMGAVPNVVGRNMASPKRTYIEDVDSIPFPAWDQLDLSYYGGLTPHRTRLELPLVTGRGCPFKCTFCCRVLGNSMRRRSVASVIAEIERNISLFGCEAIAFLDETFVLGQWTDELLSTLISTGLHKKIKWSCSTRVNSVTSALLKKMRAAGCYYIFYGLESANEETLLRIRKNITVKNIQNAVKWTKEAGILPVGAFIVGLEGTTEADTISSIELAKTLDLYSITFPIACPFPGSELRSIAETGAYGLRLTTDDWDQYSKQGGSTMESAEFPWHKRKEIQQFAYSHFPKNTVDDYMERQRRLGHPY